ncbi:MAG: TonB-dependent receptor plug domain-containing protein [Myxococcota bacterium]
MLSLLLMIGLVGTAQASEPRMDVASDGAPDDARDDEDDDVIVVTGLGQEEDASRAVHHTRVIDGDMLRASGAQTVADALETESGVQVVDGVGGTGIQLQGLDPEHTLILIDGIRVGGRVGGTLDLRRINVADIEQIEIVEGPSATLYGSDAMAGVVHIRTRRAKPGVSAEVSLSTGRWAAPARTVDATVAPAIPIPQVDTLDTHAAVSMGSERVKARVQAELHASEATDLSPETPSTDQNATRQARVSGTADFSVTPTQEWSVQAEMQSFRRWGVDSLPTGATLDRTNLTSAFSVTGGPKIELSDRRRIHILGGVRGWNDQYKADQRGSDTQDAYQRTQDVLGQLRARYDTIIGDKHVLVVGAEALGERLSADRLDPKQVTRTRVAAFVQERWDPLGDDTIAVDAAVRADVDTLFGRYLTPRVGVRVAPSDAVLFRVSGGRGFRAPDFRELYLVFENIGSGYRVDGTEGLRPETSWNVQGGLEVRPTGGSQLAIRGFANTLQDLIQADLIDPGGPGEPQRFAYVNIASARTAGGEIEAGLTDSDIGSARVSYRYTDTLDRDTGLPLSGRARHQLNTTATLRVPVWDGRLLARSAVMGPRQFVRTVGEDLTTEAAPTSVQIDLSLSLTPHKRLGVVLGVENLANAGANPADLLQTRPRRVFLTWTGSLGDQP